MRSISLIFLSLFAILSVFAQEKPVMQFKPAHPAEGNTITVAYHADAPAASLKNEKSIRVEALVYRGVIDDPVSIAAPMKSHSQFWTGSFKLNVKNATLILFRFASTPDRVDDNDGNVWDSFVFDKKGNPVPGSHYARANILATGGFYTFSHGRDLDAAKNEAEIALREEPDNFRAHLLMWNIEMARQKNNDDAKNSIRTELDPLMGNIQQDGKLVNDLVSLLNQIGDSAKASAVSDAELAAHPKGEYAKGKRMAAFNQEKNPDRKKALLDSLLSDFTDIKPDRLASLQSSLIRSFVSAKRYDDADGLLEKYGVINGSLYNSIGWSLIEKDTLMQRGIAWAKKAVEFSREPDKANKPSYVNDMQFDENAKSDLAASLDTYGYGLYQTTDYSGAEKALEEAYTLSNGEDPETNTHYVNAMLKNNNGEGVQTVSLGLVKTGNASDEIMAAFKSAYIDAKKGSDKDFDAMIADAKAAMLAKLKKRILDGKISKPSHDFTLKGLDGTPVALSALKGKVVVIDFWATWCGPCKQSFPYLQKIYDRYKDNPDVAVFAVNTWDLRGKSLAEKTANAKKFVTDKNYTMPVLIDENEDAVSAYDVDGIPTQFIIDKNGKIGFKNVGFEGPQMEDQLAMQIDILLQETVGMK